MPSRPCGGRRQRLVVLTGRRVRLPFMLPNRLYFMQIQLTPFLVLTTERTECRRGIPVLVNRHDDSTAYGPTDLIDVDHHVQPAAALVHRYGQRLKGEEREAASRYLAQWSNGPQLPAADERQTA